MFKLIKYSILVLCTVCIIPACSKEDTVELFPEFQLDAITNPSSMKQVEEVLTGAYAGLRGGNYFGSGSGTGSGWGLMPDVMSDNLYESIETLFNSNTMADFLYQPNTGQVASFYQSPYTVIAAVNIVLRDIDKFTTATNQLMANRIKGQAYVIRAMAHFDLFRYFAPSFDRNSTTDLALSYSKEFIVSSSHRPARDNNKAYYDAMLGDLTEAIALLGNVDKVINPAAGITRPYLDRAAAYAIQARIYLYGGQWAEAVTAATNAINLRPLPALNQANFSGMYNQTSVGDMIWNVQFEAGQSGPTFLVFFVTSSNRSYFRPAFEIATIDGNSGLIRSNDVRYSAYFTNHFGRLALTKYRGKTTFSDGNANFIALRTGEMYLIRAEANARSGGAGEVAGLADLNALRAARITGYVPEVLAGQALLDAIANERRRELVGEGHRFFDLKRTTRSLVRGITCGNTALSGSGTCMLAPTAREWALPIPETVRNANPNNAQNPGY